MLGFEVEHIYNPKYFNELAIDFDIGGEVLWLRMRPKARGCFTPGLLRELKRYQQGLVKWNGRYVSGSELHNVKYEVLTSDLNGVFNYGGDLELFLQYIRDNDRDALLKYGTACIDVVYPNAVNYNLKIATISLIAGDALGGGVEAALSSSTVIAERGAQFGFPEILFGLFPGMGAYSLLVRRVSPALAKEVITSGRIYSAEEFLEMGLVNHVAEKGDGVEAVKSFITKHRKHHSGYCSIDKITNLENPVCYDDMYKVVEVWVDAALSLSSKELRVMERLSRAQQKNGLRKKQTGNLNRKVDKTEAV